MSGLAHPNWRLRGCPCGGDLHWEPDEWGSGGWECLQCGRTFIDLGPQLYRTDGAIAPRPVTKASHSLRGTWSRV